MEDALEADPQRVALEEVIHILTPLRQHRQASAERQQREAEQELQRQRQRLADSRVSLIDERGRQVERRQTLFTEHVCQTLTVKDVDRWNDQERGMLDLLSQLHQDIHLQNEVVEKQQHLLQQTQLKAKAALRSVEKLACLVEAVNDEN